MKDYIEERATELGYYIINNNATVRSCAKNFNISKSTVHTVSVKSNFHSTKSTNKKCEFIIWKNNL